MDIARLVALAAAAAILWMVQAEYPWWGARFADAIVRLAEALLPSKDRLSRAEEWRGELDAERRQFNVAGLGFAASTVVAALHFRLTQVHPAGARGRENKALATVLLRNVDERTLHFGPLGLGGALPPAISERFLSEDMDSLTLPPDLPGQVSRLWDRPKRLYLNGLFSYESFTDADRAAYDVLDAALEIRFLEFYGQRIPVMIGGRHEIRAVRCFDDVRRLFRGKNRPTLEGHRWFSSSSASLMRWARAEGFLYGQRNRVREWAMLRLRDGLDKRQVNVIVMPPDAFRTLRHVFDILCRLWGHEPPDSRDYPGFLRRVPQIVGLGSQAGEARWFALEGLVEATDVERDLRDWYVVLAAEGEHLPDWQDGVERTRTPIKRLLGPADWDELASAVQEIGGTWEGDVVQSLDRLFFIRVLGDLVELPRTANQVRGLRQRVRGERWLAIKSDSPGDALGHARRWLGMASGDKACRAQGWCEGCGVEVVLPLAKRDTIDRFIRETVPTLPDPRGFIAGTWDA